MTSRLAARCADDRGYRCQYDSSSGARAPRDHRRHLRRSAATAAGGCTRSMPTARSASGLAQSAGHLLRDEAAGRILFAELGAGSWRSQATHRAPAARDRGATWPSASVQETITTVASPWFVRPEAERGRKSSRCGAHPDVRRVRCRRAASRNPSGEVMRYVPEVAGRPVKQTASGAALKRAQSASCPAKIASAFMAQIFHRTHFLSGDAGERLMSRARSPDARRGGASPKGTSRGQFIPDTRERSGARRIGPLASQSDVDPVRRSIQLGERPRPPRCDTSRTSHLRD